MLFRNLEFVCYNFLKKKSFILKKQSFLRVLNPFVFVIEVFCFEYFVVVLCRSFSFSFRSD